MPTLITKRHKKRYLAAVMVAGTRRSKLFPDSSRKSFSQAVKWEDETRKELLSNSGRIVTLRAWSEEYLKFAKVRFLNKTYRAKEAAFHRLLTFMDPKKPVSHLQKADCLHYLTDKAAKRSGNAANRDRKEFGTAFEFGRLYMGFPELNPWRLVDKFPEVEYTKYVPPLTDFEKVLAGSSGQDKIMLISLLHLAARKSELFGLLWIDIDHENKRVRLYTRKRKGGNRQADWLPATVLLLDTLKGWEADRKKIKLPGAKPDNDHVFVSLVTGKKFEGRNDFLKRLCLKAKIKRFSFHGIRHLTAMTLYRSGATTQHIQLFLRHLDPRTTSKYLKRIGVEEVRDTLENTFKIASC